MIYYSCLYHMICGRDWIVRMSKYFSSGLHFSWSLGKAIAPNLLFLAGVVVVVVSEPRNICTELQIVTCRCSVVCSSKHLSAQCPKSGDCCLAALFVYIWILWMTDWFLGSIHCLVLFRLICLVSQLWMAWNLRLIRWSMVSSSIVPLMDISVPGFQEFSTLQLFCQLFLYYPGQMCGSFWGDEWLLGISGQSSFLWPWILCCN